MHFTQQMQIAMRNKTRLFENDKIHLRNSRAFYTRKMHLKTSAKNIFSKYKHIKRYFKRKNKSKTKNNKKIKAKEEAN